MSKFVILPTAATPVSEGTPVPSLGAALGAVGRDNGFLVWERPMPGDSRMDQVRCPADWFYGQMMGAK